MRTKIKLQYLLLVGALALGSCQKEYVQPKPCTPPPPPGSVKFGADIATIFTTHCLGSGCHASGDNAPDLSEGHAYNSLKPGQMSSTSTGSPLAFCDTINPTNSVFYIRIHATTPDPQMPMSAAALPSDYQAKVLAWITAGAKNN